MLRNKLLYGLIFLGICWQLDSAAQDQTYIDSLRAEIESTSDDSISTHCYLLIANEYKQNRSPKTEGAYRQAIEFARNNIPNSFMYFTSINQFAVYFAIKNQLDSARKYFKKGYEESTDYNKAIHIELGSNLGFSYATSGMLAEATTIYNKVEKQLIEHGDSVLLSDLYARTGALERQKNNLSRSIKSYRKALEIAEQQKDTPKIGRIFFNLGNVFNDMDQPKKAFEHHTKALPYFVQANMQDGIAHVYNAMGNYYATADFQPEKALEYYGKALTISKKVGRELQIASQYNNFGVVYEKQEQYDKALKYTLMAQEIKERIGTDKMKAQAYYNTGNLYRKMKQYSKALEYAKRSLDLATKSETLQQLINAHYLLSQIYEETGKPSLALENFKTVSAYRDSLDDIRNAENLAKVQTQYEVSEKEKEIALLTKEKEVQDLKNQAELAKERNIRNIIIAGLALVVLLLFFVYNNFRTKKKANQLLEEKNEIIEEQNQKIVQSINYAKKIQSAILAEEQEVRSVFPNSFVFFKPRDIVSGDFYYFHKHKDISIVALADCTGHGVPGGFMSMIGFMLFNEIVKEKGITEPAAILEELDQGVYNTLKQGKVNAKSDDGMDMAICTYNEQTGEVAFSGAMSQMFLLEENKLKVVDGNIRTVGGSFRRFSERVKFQTQKVKPQKGSKIYLTTDGFLDQFGGPNNKKYNAKRFRDLLANVSTIPITEQEKEFDKELQNWKGSGRQIDDICVIGLAI